MSKRNRYTVLASVALLVLLGRAWEAQSPSAQGRPPRYGYRVVNTYPHDSQAYTQGLVYRNGFLFESTGLNGRSTLRKVKLETGEVIQQERIDTQYFAEGLTEWNGRLLQLLNELEYVRGEVYANVWHTDRIARISPESGRVIGWIDLTGLLSKVYQLDAEAVLNGIAFDAERDRLFVTGKLWPRLFEITLERR